jgi:hypothetical protein
VRFGALMRLLAEMTWFPTALLDERYVTWAPVDDAQARATLRVADGEGKTCRHLKSTTLDELPREAVRGWQRTAAELAPKK